MKPAAFEYIAPDSLAEVCGALAQYHSDAIVLAGGQSLLPLLNLRLVRPRVLVDIGRIQELQYVRTTDGVLHVGAGTTQHDLEFHPALEQLPVLRTVLRHVGYPTTRNRGTVGGSLAYGDPTAELPLALVALGGSVTAHSSNRVREIHGRDLYRAPFATALRDDELLTEARFPLPTAGVRVEFSQIDFRRRAIKLTALVAAQVVNGQCESLDLALTGIAETPLLLSQQASEVLRGSAPTPAAIKEAVRRCTTALTPNGDRYGSAEYKRRITAHLLRQVCEHLFGLGGKGR